MKLYIHTNSINISDCTYEELNRLKEMTPLKQRVNVEISAETNAEKALLYELIFDISTLFDTTIR